MLILTKNSQSAANILLPLHDWLSKLATKPKSANSQHYVATVRTVVSPAMVKLADDTR